MLQHRLHPALADGKRECAGCLEGGFDSETNASVASVEVVLGEDVASADLADDVVTFRGPVRQEIKIVSKEAGRQLSGEHIVNRAPQSLLIRQPGGSRRDASQ